MDNYELLMTYCFELALKAQGLTSPNPLVGSVIINNGEIIGQGFHRGYGLPHAEVEAIRDAEINGFSLCGATLFSNLEPCCHRDKQTPPCTDLIIKKGIKKVVVSNEDPNPKVSGRGLTTLHDAGIEIIKNILPQKGNEINKIFFHTMKTSLPYMHLKAAITLDGKMATKNGESKWITNEESRTEVHRLRKKYDGILIGKNTLLADNPSLTIRMGIPSNGKVLKKIILGLPENIDKKWNIFSESAKDVLFLSNLRPKNEDEFQVYKLQDTHNLKEVSQKLFELGINSILVEGGAQILSSFIKQDIWNEISLFMSPTLFGSGISWFQDDGLERVLKAKKFENINYSFLGKDLRIDVKR